jgi:hypothetical protein
MLYCCHAGRLTTVHVQGKDNIMADIASRLSKANAMFHSESPVLSDPKLISSFNITFLLPDQQEWQLAMVPPRLKLNVFETLRGRQLDLQQWMVPSGTNIGAHVRSIAASSQSTVRGQGGRPATLKTCSSPLLSPCGKASTASAVKSKFSQLLLLSELSPKNMFWTDMLTQDGRPRPNIP